MNLTAKNSLLRSCICLVACCVMVLGDIVICPKCGYEVAGREAVCSHCGAALPARAAPQVPGAPSADQQSPEPDKPGPLDASVVETEIALGEKAFKDGNMELARLLFRNAASMDSLTGHGEDTSHADRVLKFVRECEPAGKSMLVKCPGCGGKGKRIVKRANTWGKKQVLEIPGRTCEPCGGTGKVKSFGSISERKYQRGRAEREYRLMQQGRKLVPVGNAWLPKEVAATLSPKQIAAVQRPVVSPCTECMGFGRNDCRTCAGKGRVKCPGKGCVEGMVKLEKNSNWSSTVFDRWQKCEKCLGFGFVKCTRCDGKGSFVCDECSGSGERERCSRCGGEGVGPCRRCKGSGRYRDGACDTCGGRGTSLCASCMGDGRRR